MTFIATKDMTPEQAIKAAAEFAGVKPETLDGMWRTETNRGKHPTMVGPQTKWGQAKGHFQQLDSIQKEFSKRLGREFDPFDFHDSLTMASHQMKENMARYKSEDKAVMAYHGGTNQKNWGAKTKDYVAKVMGVQPSNISGEVLGNVVPVLPRSTPVVDGEGKKPGMPASSIWDADDQQMAAMAAATAAENGGAMVRGRAFDVTEDKGQIVDLLKGEEALAQAKQAEIDNRTFFGDVLPAAYENTMNPSFRLMARIFGDGDYQQDPAFMAKLRENWAPAVQGFAQEHEQQFLLNSVNEEDYNRRKFHLEEQRRTSQIVAEDGIRGMGAMMLAGAADPTTYIAGFGAMKVMHLTGRGAITLAQQGRVAGAVASSAAENAVGNVAYEVAQAAMGEHRSFADYAMASALGMLPAAMSVPGLSRTASVASLNKSIADAAKRDAAQFETVVKDLGEDAKPAEIIAEVQRREATRLADEVQAVRGGRVDAGPAPVTVRDATAPDAIAEAQAEIDAEVAARKPAQAEPAAPKADGLTADKVEKAVAEAKLPAGLEGAKPKYSYGAKQFELEFDSDLMKALYIVAGKKGSKADASYMQFVMDQTGATKAQARVMGQIVRENIKKQAASAPAGAKLRLVANDLVDVKGMELKSPDKTRTYRQELDAALASGEFDPFSLRKTAIRRMVDAARPETWDAPVLRTTSARAMIDTRGRAHMPEKVSIETTLHEGVHLTTMSSIQKYIDGRGAELEPHARKAVWELDKQYKRLKKEWEAENGRKVRPDPADDGVEYAFKNLHEFAAQAFSDRRFQNWLVQRPGTKTATAWRDFVESIAKMLGIKVEGTALDEVLDGVDAVIKANQPDAVGTSVYAPKINPIDEAFDRKYGLDGLPEGDAIGRAKKKAMRAMLRDMEEWVAKNPRNDDAAKTIMDNKVVNMATPATLLAQSDHPAARWVSAVLLEQTMGAHGRKPNAAIAADTLAKEYQGAFVTNFDNLYVTWRNETAGRWKGIMSDLMDNKLRQDFNTKVAAEIEGRLLGHPESPIKQVRDAANLAEKQFELMRQEQIANGTPGFGALPETSRGYMPHLLDSAKVGGMNDSQRRAYVQALKAEFRDGLEDMDDEFAERVAKAYVKHATDRAMGLSDIPADPLNHRAAEYIRESMKAAGMTYEEIRLMENKMNRGAASHTKKRLKLDTLKVHKADDGSEFRLLDLFRTDMNDIVRVHARRVAGEVALTRFGVQGSAGLELIKEMLSLSGDMKLNPDQVKAMKQTFSELLGRPIDLSEESQALNGLLTYTSLTKLGGMGITQLGEYSNMALHLGLAETMAAQSSVPRLLAEIRAIARGEQVDNGILGSMEFRGGGGEFGLDGYRVSRFDTTGREFEAYGQSSSNAVIRGLKQTSYGMGILTMHRAVQGVQQRGAAEQIVLKVWRKVRAGEDVGVALQDMGFSPEVTAKMRAHMDAAVTFDSAGRVKTFDITKLPQDLQVEFDQATRRGVAQIIQGTFIGERGHWVHSGMGRLLTQFRNYPIVAMEKQLGRTMVAHGSGARGAAVAAGMIIAAAGMVLPVYGARVAFNAMTRDDRDEYIDRMMAPEEVLKNVMNYIALTGLMQDVTQGLFSIAGSLNEDWKWMESTGGREGTGRTTLGTLIPAVGSVEELLRLPANTDDAHKMVRALPYSNTPLLLPFIEALRN